MSGRGMKLLTDLEIEEIVAEGRIPVARGEQMGAVAMSLGVATEISSQLRVVSVEAWFFVLWLKQPYVPAFLSEAMPVFKEKVELMKRNPRSIVLLLGEMTLARPYMHTSEVNSHLTSEQFRTALSVTVNRFSSLEKSCENS